MNTSTLIFKSKVTAQSLLFGMFLALLSFVSISSAKAQNISELNQFLESQEATDLGIDREYLFGSQSVIHISQNRITLPEEGNARKADVRMNGISRISEAADDLKSVEILQLKVRSEADKSMALSSGIEQQIPSLKVIFVLSEIPISESEVQRMVSSLQNSAIKILYLYSQPV